MEPDAEVKTTGAAVPACPVCGATNKATAKFCRQCGAPLTARQDEAEEARRRDELARLEAAAARSAAQASGEVAQGRPRSPGVGGAKEPGAPRKGLSKSAWYAIVAAVLALGLTLGWGIWSQRLEQGRLEREKQAAVEAENQRAAAAAEAGRQRHARALEEERKRVAEGERARMAREQEQAKAAEAARLEQELKAARLEQERKAREAAAQRQLEEEAAAQRQRETEAAAQRQREVETATQRQREEQARARSQPPGTWRDERTGLLWTAKDNGAGINWDKAMSYCGRLTLGGFSDWRMPWIGELEGLYYAGSGKKYKTRGEVVLTSWWVWSADVDPGHTSKAWWAFDFRGGERLVGFSWPTGGCRALCVRSSGELR